MTYSWYGTEELLKFVKELSQKHKKIKFDFKFTKTKIKFLNVLAYKNINNKHANSEHPRPLKESIPYS